MADEQKDEAPPQKLASAGDALAAMAAARGGGAPGGRPSRASADSRAMQLRASRGSFASVDGEDPRRNQSNKNVPSYAS